MNNKQKHFFNIAKEISLLGDYKRAKVGAVVVEKNRIISTGHNAYKTSTTQAKYNKYRDFREGSPVNHRVHAEIAALSPLLHKNDIDWEKVDIYVYRSIHNGESCGCSRPCKACAALIADLNIRNIYYIDENGNFKMERNL